MSRHTYKVLCIWGFSDGVPDATCAQQQHLISLPQGRTISEPSGEDSFLDFSIGKMNLIWFWVYYPKTSYVFSHDQI